MQIKTTGIEQYLPDGEANIKSLIVGGPGVGKTRWSSYWPMPIYANIEAGLASIADRTMPYVDIDSSKDMLDFLRWLKQHPDAKKYGTVVIDTLDAFHRKVKDEWLRANPSESAFAGYDAWGYLESKMSALMTRLLSLPMNVIVLVHYKDKTVTEGSGSNKVERHVFELQLQGDIKHTAFNDFDLVGWMDTYWESVEVDGANERVQRRGITFKPTPQRPFLKDRLNITPEWLPVEFAESDYTNLFERFTSRLDELKDGEVIGEIESLPEAEEAISTEGVRRPEPGGPTAPQDPREEPLDKKKKPALIELAKEEGVEGIKTSMLKDEIIAAIEAHRAKKKAEPQKAASEPEPAQEAASEPAKAEPSAEAPAPESASESADPDAAPRQEHKTGCTLADGHDSECKTKAELEADEATEASASSDDVDSSTDVQEDGGQSDQDESEQEATKDVEDVIKQELGGEVVSETPAAEATSTPKQEAKKEADATCEACGKSLAGEVPDLVRLAYIKTRKNLCNEDYRKFKAGELEL